MEELKPCPFCGELPIQFVKDGLTQIRCNNTQCWIVPATSFYTYRKTAVEAWNRRAQPANEPLTRDCVEEAPAADVAQVVHGRWILLGKNEHDYETSVEEKCSLCGRYVYRYDTELQDNYCPNCGAKMDREDET